jgi:hypothetical protein
VGVDWIDQDEPLSRSTRGAPKSLPTAVHAVAALQDTLASSGKVVLAGSVAWTVHIAPAHASASGARLEVAPVNALPTALHAVVVGHETP